MKQWLFILVICSSLAQGSELVPVDGFAATVNQRVVTVGEVMSALQPLERRLRASYSGRELMIRLEDAYQQVLNSMIEHALILEEFDKREGMIPSQLVDEHVQSIVVENFNGDRGALLRQLALEGITMEEWREDIRDRIAVMILRQEEVVPHVVVSPRQIRDAFEARRDEFKQEAQSWFRMMVFLADKPEDRDRPPALEKAQLVRERLEAGEDFADLAMAYSEDTRARRGGDWGWTDPSILREELALTVGQLSPGEFSAPVETPEAVYLIKLEDRREASVTPFSEVRDQLADTLRREEEERIYQAWMERLRARHHVRTFDLPRSELVL